MAVQEHVSSIVKNKVDEILAIVSVSGLNSKPARIVHKVASMMFRLAISIDKN